MIAIRDAQPLALLHSVCRSFLCHRWQRSSPCRCCEGMTITIDRPSYLGNSVWNRSWRLAWITWPSRPGWGRRWFKPARCWLWHLKSSASLWLSWTMAWWSKRWWWTHLPPSWQSRCSLPTTCQSPTAGFPHMKPPSASLSAQGSSLNPTPVSQVKLLPMSTWVFVCQELPLLLIHQTSLLTFQPSQQTSLPCTALTAGSCISPELSRDCR